MGKVSSYQLGESSLALTLMVNRLDASNSSGLKEDLEKIWKDSITSLTIDLRNVQFMDSSGVGALLSVYKKIKNHSENAKLINVQPEVLTVLELLRLNRVFEIVGN